MSEQAPAEQATQTEAKQGEPADLGDAGKKALAAERDARKAAENALKATQEKLAQFEQANLSEVEKAQKAAQEAQAQLANLTRQNTINTVALAKGVPADLVSFLSGDSEDEVSAKADLLLARLNAPTTPRPDHTQGAATPLALNDDDGLTGAIKTALGL